ncbi:hypothetical protein R1sor_014659 [Riccia sorocarpa]|uniref:WAT1-related protein n=1 Tax=Riccia sorocarpa TaxID=122646 RepID=A0ABD3HA16_9MARC
MHFREAGDDRNGQKTQIPAHIALLIAQVLAAVYYVVSRLALVGGMNRIVLSFYRDIVAMIVLIPAAFFIDRGTRIKFSKNMLIRFLLLGTLGVYGSNYLLFVGIEYTSLEFASELQPVGPPLVAIVAVLFGYEAIYWHRRDGKAKALGVLISCVGGIFMTFYKGPAVLPWRQVGDAVPWSPVNDSSPVSGIPGPLRTTIHDLGITRWQFGALCLIGHAVCFALYLNLQEPLLRKYPAPVSITAYSYTIGAILMGLTGAYAVRDSSAWTLSWNADLASVFYAGIIGSALNYSLISWCLGRVGPVFVATYLPVQRVMSTLLSLVVVGTTLYLGSIVGTVMVLLGILLVTWSHKERNRLASLSRLIFQRRYSDSFNESIQEPFIEVRT